MPATTVPGGLVDAHAHLTLDLDGAGLAPGPGRVAGNLAAAHAAGVLALRDAGSRDGIEAALLDPTRQVAAGRFLAPEGGHLPGLFVPVAPERLVAEVERQARAGVPWIKVMADFPGAGEDWFAPSVTYAPALVAQACAAAHAHGARVMAHVSGPVVADLVAAGIDEVAHAPLVDAPLLEAMARRGTAWCPTLATIERRIRPIADGPAARAARARWPVTLPLAVRLGVPVLAGTDELGPRGLATEIAALVRLGGLTPAQALAAATTVPRAVLRLPIPDGDAVVIDGDPAEDVTALGRVLEVRRGPAAAPPRRS